MEISSLHLSDEKFEAHLHGTIRTTKVAIIAKASGEFPYTQEDEWLVFSYRTYKSLIQNKMKNQHDIEPNLHPQMWIYRYIP